MDPVNYQPGKFDPLYVLYFSETLFKDPHYQSIRKKDGESGLSNESVLLDNQQTIPTDWRKVMEKNIQDLKKKISELDMNDRNDRKQCNIYTNRIKYIYENLESDFEERLASEATKKADRAKELKNRRNQLLEHLSNFDPVLARHRDPEPTASSVKSPNKPESTLKKTKGQLISEDFFIVFRYTKKTNEIF